MAGTYHNNSFPSVPPSLSADDHGMRDDYVIQEPTAERYEAHSLNDITPYLGLRSRLSQVWLNKWTILILLVLVRLLILTSNLRDNISDAEIKALKGCTTVEAMGSTVASMPHYLADGTNALAAKGVTKAVDGLQEMLFMAITAVEEIFVFVINMMYGTYECLITFAVGGAAHVAIQLAEDVTSFLNKTLGGIANDIDSGVNTFESGFNSFLADLSSVPDIFGGKVNPPTINLNSSVSALHNIQLPTDINDSLNKLNASIPDFSQVQNFTNTALELPFEEVKKLLNQTLGVYTFNQSIFPVPARQSLEFCSNDGSFDDFFNELYNVADMAKKIFIGVLLTAAILACIPFAILEMRRWATMKARSKLIGANSFEPLDIVYLVSRPMTAVAGLKLSRRISSPKRSVLTRWFVAYITSTPALIVLAIALAGLFSALCQYILLKALEREVPALAAEVGQFADKVVFALNNASATWANQTNTAILAENTRINDDVFGWVNTTTTALNSTLNSFINETTGVLQKAFGGTVLEDPVQQVFNCLIGLKVASIEKGLTWVQDNAHIDFPLFPNDTFSQGAAKAVAGTNFQTGTTNGSDSFLAGPNSDASDAISEAVTDLVAKLAAGIRTEALLATAVLLCYVAVVLMAAARVLWLMLRREKMRARGGPSYAGDIDAAGLAADHRQPYQYPLRTGTVLAPVPEHVDEKSISDEPRGAGAFQAFRHSVARHNPFATPFDDNNNADAAWPIDEKRGTRLPASGTSAIRDRVLTSIASHIVPRKTVGGGGQRTGVVSADGEVEGEQEEKNGTAF